MKIASYAGWPPAASSQGSVDLRRRVNARLNKGEARNALARAVFFDRLRKCEIAALKTSVTTPGVSF
jgi:hypothetical protein